MKYSTFVREWVDGLYSEIDFWENYIKMEGRKFSHQKYLEQISPDKRFFFENILPEGGKIRFADIGSGPFSRCGRKTDKCDLDITCVDPLGSIYEQIKEKYSINNGNRIVRGFVEFLDQQFGSNSFDIVHMSNSLDHCFDPIFGIYQLINICKVGGKIILRHHENEAMNENYTGLHQWNLSLHNEENSFIIWNKEKRIDICKEFKNYVDFKLVADVTELGGSWIYNYIEMTKKCDIQIPDNKYGYLLLMEVYDAFTSINYELVQKNIGDRIERKRKEIIQQIINGEFDNELMEAKRNVIWGYGKIGETLADRLEILGINYLVIDKYKFRNTNSKKYKKIEEYFQNKGDRVWITFHSIDKDDCVNRFENVKILLD